LYHDFQMRRGFAIFLILLFGLGPLADALPGSEDLRLPPCCRRHGAHHCVLYMRYAAARAQAESGKPFFSAPLTCPCCPGTLGALPSAVHALAASPASLPVLLAQAHSPAAGRAAARLSQIRTRAGRGPPAMNLA
jgi:hypothetical protein